MGHLNFKPARAITAQEYQKIIGTDDHAPLAGKRLSNGRFESGISGSTIEDFATFHIVEDLDRDGKREDFYFRVKTEGPLILPRHPPPPFQATFSFFATTRCRGDACHEKWELHEREPYAESTLEGVRFAVLKGAFLADVTGDGVRDIVILTDNIRSRSSLDSLLRGATVLEGERD